MNINDQHNLDFLFSISEEGLKAWYEQATEDDLLYAAELLNQYEQQLDSEHYGVAFVPHNDTVH